MDTPVSPGDVLLGKYKVERVLGKGGMGVVVAARHLELGELFAIKFLLPSMLSQRDALERFLREARAAAKLRSEHVARVHDVGRMENGTPYMLMEYLDGRDLKEVLKDRGRLPLDVAAEHLVQVCDAIAEAHAAGIVHRDLKPANLFLTQRPNGSNCVKVLDFGISKRVGPDEADLTGTSAMFGSPLYMSPEQISKTKSVDARSDIWSLGVILYELVAGQTPFTAPSAMEAISRILQEEPTPVREVRPDVTPAIDAIIARCLRKKRDERFQSTGELAKALRESLSSGSNDASTATIQLVVNPPAETAPSVVSAEPEKVPAKRWMKTLPLASAAASPSAPDPAPEQLCDEKADAAPGAATAAAWGHTGNLPAQASRGKRYAIGVTVALLTIGGGLWFVMKPPEDRMAVPAASTSTSPTEQGSPESTSATASPKPEASSIPPPTPTPTAAPQTPTEATTATPETAPAPTSEPIKAAKPSGPAPKPQATTKAKTTPPKPSGPQRYEPSDI